MKAGQRWILGLLLAGCAAQIGLDESEQSLVGEETLFAQTHPKTAMEQDSQAVEVGVRFRSSVAGDARGVRFYKGGTRNGGTHVGHLWRSDGTLLASVTFGAESAAGWQRALFAKPVALSPGAVYVVSYLAPRGHYAAESSYFQSQAHLRGHLEALRDGDAGPNGVYHYGSSSFPSDSYRSTHYGVDIVFVPTVIDAGTQVIDAGTPVIDAGTPVIDAGTPPPDAGTPPPAGCAKNPWASLEACGWPGPGNTGYDLAQCPGGLTEMGSSAAPGKIFDVGTGSVIRCQRVHGSLHITGRNVLVQNSFVTYDSGKRGTDANGTAAITVDDGASATVDHVEIDGSRGAHACIWNQGTPAGSERSLVASHVNCYNVNDGIFSWADTGYSQTTGDGFVVEDSYIHDLTTLTANGHEDGYQTEGARDGLIRHNTFALTADADSCVAIWNGLRSSSNITVSDNLMAGGGAAIYAEDYSPSESSPQGGFSTTSIVFNDNQLSTHVSPCVGSYFVWYDRPSQPYRGGPTDGWHRSGNVVIETGEKVDDGNPHVQGQLCN